MTEFSVKLLIFPANSSTMTTATPIPLVDMREQYQMPKTDIVAAVADVMDKTQIITGPIVKRFDAEAAAHLGVSNAIGYTHCTNAPHLALLGPSLRPGDEVITTPFTYSATAEAITYVGASPVFVDLDPTTDELQA